MKKADRVLIIEFQNKYSDSGDNEISDGTNSLAKKASTLGIPVETVFYLINGDDFVGTSHYMKNMNPLSGKSVIEAIKTALAKLTPSSELIIRGHGNGALGTVSRIGGSAMANFLCELGLSVNCKINITSCKGARGPSFADLADVSGLSAEEIMMRSFAYSFQQALFRNGLKSNEIHARVQNVIVKSNGSKTTRTHGSTEKGQHTHHQPNSKLVFKGDGRGGSSYAYAY